MGFHFPLDLSPLSTYVHGMFYTYIVTDKTNGTLCTGHTDDVWMRELQHRTIALNSGTARKGCTQLVWFEPHPSREAAFQREREVKKWSRAWQVKLIEDLNPDWLDLAAAALRFLPPPRARNTPVQPVLEDTAIFTAFAMNDASAAYPAAGAL